MATSPAKIATNQSNAQHSTGPRTDSGKSASSQNARKYGLFSAKDFIRPEEQSEYDELDQSLRADLYPEGRLEHHLVDEIRRAMWRLRRCGEVEAGMVETCAQHAAQRTIPDPMQNEPTAAIQLAVDRARAQCHRLLHKCVAELRKLQTERQFRVEYFEGKRNYDHLGIADWRTVNKALGETAQSILRQTEVSDSAYERGRYKAQLEALATVGEDDDDIPPTLWTPERAREKRTQTARNAQCPCGSGLKHKRCCGQDAPPVLHDRAA